jgi:hypothetical protein
MTAFEVPGTIESATIIDHSHTFLPTPWQYTTCPYTTPNIKLLPLDVSCTSPRCEISIRVATKEQNVFYIRTQV